MRTRDLSLNRNTEQKSTSKRVVVYVVPGTKVADDYGLSGKCVPVQEATAQRLVAERQVWVVGEETE